MPIYIGTAWFEVDGEVVDRQIVRMEAANESHFMGAIVGRARGNPGSYDPKKISVDFGPISISKFQGGKQ